MKCHTNVNYTPPAQLPHKFSYLVAILIHNHFESPNIIVLVVFFVKCHKNEDFLYVNSIEQKIVYAIRV
jgi:hypothetical protein